VMCSVVGYDVFTGTVHVLLHVYVYTHMYSRYEQLSIYQLHSGSAVKKTRC
jgi:hypothetical protein